MIVVTGGAGFIGSHLVGRIPCPAALAAACASEFVADVFTHRSPAATATGVKLMLRRMHFNPQRSLSEMQLQLRPVSESLAETVTLFREVGWVR
jgi:dihydroflavonol-4-reductase